MRTKYVEGILRLDVSTWAPRIEIGAVYDGLGGLSQRNVLLDVVEELHRQGPDVLNRFLKTLRDTRRGFSIHVSFMDYVSYGIGGGDAVAEFPYRSFLVLYHPPALEPEHLEMVMERILVPADGAVNGVPLRTRLSLEGLGA